MSEEIPQESINIVEMGSMDNPFSSRNKIRDEGKPNVTFGRIQRMKWKTQIREELLELVTGRFEYEGLPEYIPPHYLEENLILMGVVLIYKNDDGVHLGVGTRGSKLTHYNESATFKVISPVGEHDGEYILDKNAVLIKNNRKGRTDIDLIDLYADVMVDIRTTQLTNLTTMRTPFMLKMNNKIYNSVIEQYNQIIDGAPYIKVDPELTENHGETLDVLVTNTPYYLDQLQTFLNDIRNELLTQLGVNNNPSSDKKERLLVDEVNSNNNEIGASIATRLKEREYALEKANKILGTNITVKLSKQFQMDEDAEGSVSNVNYFSNRAAETRKEKERGDE